MGKWLKALFSETIFSIWWVLSALSTLSTFFFPGWSGKPRLISAISAVLGFVLANLRVFQKQEARIAALNQSVESHETRTAQLRITPDNASRYILRPVGPPHGDFNGGFLEFHLMIENTGRRSSTVNDYEVEILEIQQRFPNLQPQEGLNAIGGRHCQHGLGPERSLSVTGNIRIEAEDATNRGTLLFFIPGINLEQFVNAACEWRGPKEDLERCTGASH